MYNGNGVGLSPGQADMVYWYNTRRPFQQTQIRFPSLLTKLTKWEYALVLSRENAPCIGNLVCHRQWAFHDLALWATYTKTYSRCCPDAEWVRLMYTLSDSQRLLSECVNGLTHGHVYLRGRLGYQGC